LKSIAAGSFIFIAVASVVRWLSLKINQVQFYVMKTTLWSNLQFTPK
jgi:hypothetical protein